MTDFSDERIAHLVRLAARGFQRSLQIRLGEAGVTFGQWIFLRILWDHDGASQRELSRLAQLTEPTTHTAIAKLEGLGLVERKPVGGDRRRLDVFLTPAGRDLRAKLEPMAVESNDVALAGLSAAEVGALRKALLKIIDNLEADEAAEGRAGRHIPATRTGARRD